MYLLLKACSSVQLGKRQMSTKPQNYEQTPPISQQNKICPHCEQLTSILHPPQKKKKKTDEGRVEVCAPRYLPQVY